MMPAGLNSLSSSVAIDAADTKKRSRDLGGEKGDLTPEDLSKLNLPERKRHREKKRRRETTKGFDDLMNLLVEIDPKVRIDAEERAQRGQWKESIGAQEDSVLTRVETITRTVDALRRVHRENEERKVIIMELTRRGSGVGLGGPTVVMHDEVRNRETIEHMGRRASFHSQQYLFFVHRSLLGYKDVPDGDAQPFSRILRLYIIGTKCVIPTDWAWARRSGGFWSRCGSTSHPAFLESLWHWLSVNTAWELSWSPRLEFNPWSW
jgi:hypothetical protein